MDFRTTKVKKITPVGIKNVWDITVEDDHSYVGNGIVHHNSNPNMTNYPADIRGQHIPRPGYIFIQFDLSQAEIRIAAAFSNDKDLMQAMYAEDFHKATAALIFNKPIEEIIDSERQYAKMMNFAILYGASAFMVSKALRITVEEAEDLIRTYKARFVSLTAWMDEVLEKAKENGYVETAFGTRLGLNNLDSTDAKVRSHAERVAVNAPVQGTGGELIFYFNFINEQKFAKKFEETGDPAWKDIRFLNDTHDFVLYEAPLSLIKHLGEEDEDGRYPDAVTEIADIICETVRVDGCQVGPLGRVKFELDLQVCKYFYKKPNGMKAVDPKYGNEAKQLSVWKLLSETKDSIYSQNSEAVSSDEFAQELKEELEDLQAMEEAYVTRKS